MKRPAVLSIAGSDPSGGAGIQADLKTMTAFGCYGMTAITAITVQNTLGVTGVTELPADLAGRQIDAVFFRYPADAVKIGMVSSGETIRVIAEKLREYEAENIVLDPVMVSTSGHRLIREEAMDALVHELLPAADLITPNLREAEALLDMPVQDRNDMIRAGEKLFSVTGHPVLLKGGHLRTAPMIFCSWTAALSGIPAPAYRRRTATAPDVPCPRRLPPDWRSAFLCRTP